jgi:hypothetical protein
MSLHLSDLNISGMTNNGERISFSISGHTDRADESMLNITAFNEESFNFLNNSNGSLHLSDLNVSSSSNGIMADHSDNYSEGHTSMEGDSSFMNRSEDSILPVEHSDENHEIYMDHSIDLSGGRRKTRKTRKRKGRKKRTVKKSRKNRRKHT